APPRTSRSARRCWRGPPRRWGVRRRALATWPRRSMRRAPAQGPRQASGEPRARLLAVYLRHRARRSAPRTRAQDAAATRRVADRGTPWPPNGVPASESRGLASALSGLRRALRRHLTALAKKGHELGRGLEIDGLRGPRHPDLARGVAR